MSRYAQEIDFGGETVGTRIWPPMGSGQYASAGWTHASYIRGIVYRDANNHFYNPSLTADQRWPSCQTASNPAWGGSVWKTYFFFGGPGGYNC
jgi:Neprosin